MLKFDNDIAAADQAIRACGQKWADELARSYLALNDKACLKAILEKTMVAAKQEQDELAREPKIVEEGTYKRRKLRRYDNGAIEGELLVGWVPAVSNAERIPGLHCVRSLAYGPTHPFAWRFCSKCLFEESRRLVRSEL